MIKSDRQLKITEQRAQSFDEAIKAHNANDVPAGVHPRAHKVALDALIGLRDELRQQIAEYRELVEAGPAAVQINSLADIPRALIRARIARRVTQRQLAERLGVKPQQVQRWESESYENATYASIVEVAMALGLDASFRSAEAAEAAFSPMPRVGFPRSRAGRDLVQYVVVERSSVDDTGAKVSPVTWRQPDGSIEGLLNKGDKLRGSGVGAGDGNWVRPVKAQWRFPTSERRSFALGAGDE